MNTQEKLSAERIATLMRAARKRAGLGQVDIAQKLGISQGAVSRTEHGILIPSAPIWFDFCKLTDISPDSLVTGFIEKSSPALLESPQGTAGFKIHSRYTTDRGSKIRAMLPFLSFFESIYGSQGMKQFLASIRVDPDFIVDHDNQINLNFCMDIASRLIKDGHLKARSLGRLAKAANQRESHGSMHSHYDSVDGALNRLQVLLRNARFYECNFDYKIEDFSSTSIQLSVTPNEHLKRFNYKNDELGDLLCRYKQHYFQQFAFAKSPSKEGQLIEKECLFHGGTRCVYEISVV